MAQCKGQTKNSRGPFGFHQCLRYAVDGEYCKRHAALENAKPEPPKLIDIWIVSVINPIPKKIKAQRIDWVSWVTEDGALRQRNTDRCRAFDKLEDAIFAAKSSAQFEIEQSKRNIKHWSEILGKLEKLTDNCTGNDHVQK